MLQFLAGVLISGMLLGDFQSNALLNRLAHGGIALILSAMLCAELSGIAPRWLVALCGFSLTVALGAGTEVAEAVALAGEVVLLTRFYNTIYALSANLVGAGLGAMAGFK